MSTSSKNPNLGFEGKGGKYLVLPPEYKGDLPEGYIAVRPNTYNTMTLLRSILASSSEADLKAGDGLVQQVKIYPLSKAGNPPAQHLPGPYTRNHGNHF
jgi:hypothetical protein